MEPINLNDLLASTGARLVSGPRSVRFTSVSTDTRTVSDGALFVALQGPRFDGNAFAGEALTRGARGVLTTPGRAPEDPPKDRVCLEHADPGRAFLDLAGWYRRRFTIPFVGIGGAAGKTTTKEMAGQVLSRFLPTVYSEKSFNNSVGVPATLLRVDGSTRVAVVEIGTNARGEVAQLAKVVAPTVGLVTCIAEEHLEGLGSLEGVAEEEGDLPAALPEDGVAILNADDRFFAALRSRTRCRVVTFGLESDADYRATDVVFHVAGCSFRVQGKPATVPLLGTHNVYNAVSVVALASVLGFGLEESLGALAELRPPQRRMERKRFGDVEVIDDCYNANPASVRAAVRALEGLRVGRRRVLVLGKMHELGEGSKELHRDVGRAVGQSRVDLFIAVGAESEALLRGAVEGGLSPARMLALPTAEEAVSAVPDLVKPGDLVLVKGSRAEGLERIVDALAARYQPREAGE
ncbi:MAG: UDP-N-acetylmuramoyl-tripeptide--D-alanyl-D-alanine ligase [Planctomycetes bacterium]|nr:UDP-N-acetylmuramoyl-tripeptide--D-alanyl-D-alanine ligase [Planctomycetota bacterium]